MDTREKPIICRAHEVVAILGGSKTQARRLVKNPYVSPAWDIRPALVPRFPNHTHDWWLPNATAPAVALRCPYGAVGDRLWVRECFAAWWITATKKRSHVMGYRADIDDPNWDGFGCDDPWWLDATWEPSIHMPRIFSRLTLEITDIRVERLQAMEGQAPYPGESDALAEGVHRIHHGDGEYCFSAFRDESHPKNWIDPTDAFRELWDSINAKRAPWASNPWVWVLTFKVVTP
jgi:hypothetical protein